jgi:hypothetical protein
MMNRDACEADAKVITIHASVTNLNGKYFQEMRNAEVIAFEPGSKLQTLDSQTFLFCSSLKSITFPASLECLPRHLFTTPSSLRQSYSPVETVKFERGSKLREIANEAFSGCPLLQSICIPASVEILSAGSFAECGLTAIEIESTSNFYHITGTGVMDLSDTLIVRCFAQASEIRIPDSVETLGHASFQGCSWISHIVFGPCSKLSYIRGRAFAHCDQIKSIFIPSLVTDIGAEAFRWCHSLRSVSFAPDSRLEHIEDRCFGESALESMALPASVAVLGMNCFSHCERLVAVTFSADSKLVRIEGVFYGCSSLRSLCLPSSVEYVGDNSFVGCRALSDLTFSQPSHLRQMRDLPPAWNGLKDLPDSLEMLSFSGGFVRKSELALSFGGESKLRKIVTDSKRLFLHVSSRTLKILRSDCEYRDFPSEELSLSADESFILDGLWAEFDSY